VAFFVGFVFMIVALLWIGVPLSRRFAPPSPQGARVKNTNAPRLLKMAKATKRGAHFVSPSLREALAPWQSMQVLFGPCPFRLRRVENPPHPNPLPLKGARETLIFPPPLTLPISPQRGGRNTLPLHLWRGAGGEDGERGENNREGDGDSWIPSPCEARVRERGFSPMAIHIPRRRFRRTPFFSGYGVAHQSAGVAVHGTAIFCRGGY
jgi:hypothetical protein